LNHQDTKRIKISNQVEAGNWLMNWDRRMAASPVSREVFPERPFVLYFGFLATLASWRFNLVLVSS
jgi:hypothetical protein